MSKEGRNELLRVGDKFGSHTTQITQRKEHNANQLAPHAQTYNMVITYMYDKLYNSS